MNFLERALYKVKVMDEIFEKAANIKLVVFDVDGVLTDSTLYFGDDGQEYKAFNSKDGHGMKMLQQGGVPIAIITARESNVVRHRMANLGIEHVFQGQKEKLPCLLKLAEELKLEMEEIAYVGDDVIDLPVMVRVGLPIAVGDAHNMVKQHAMWTTRHNGGRGAAREVCEAILQGQGKLTEMLQSYVK
jgi:3-deoxy-D-manno-octulosonate 8-phosphate phosphatase (KDO 8-P phosphatase)